jgi:hypothetical protein
LSTLSTVFTPLIFAASAATAEPSVENTAISICAPSIVLAQATHLAVD